MILIGIDTGVNTGFAVSDNGVLERVESLTIYKAINQVESIVKRAIAESRKVKIYIEDARLRTWIPKSKGREVLQGAGSVKRDSQIWQEVCAELGVDYELVAPKNNKTKTKKDEFKGMTGWQGRTNEHGRDAAMLIFGRK